MKMRVHGLPEEVAETVKRLHDVFALVSVSDPYQDRGASRLVRVYVKVRL